VTTWQSDTFPHRLANESRGCAPSTDGDEHPSLGADYGDIVPSVKSPLNDMCEQTNTRQPKVIASRISQAAHRDVLLPGVRAGSEDATG
jgi:hypothetical protein